MYDNVSYSDNLGVKYNKLKSRKSLLRSLYYITGPPSSIYVDYCLNCK